MEDPVAVCISLIMKAKSMEWTYDMFKQGCASVKADNIQAWKVAIGTIRMKY